MTGPGGCIWAGHPPSDRVQWSGVGKNGAIAIGSKGKAESRPLASSMRQDDRWATMGAEQHGPFGLCSTTHTALADGYTQPYHRG